MNDNNRSICSTKQGLVKIGLQLQTTLENIQKITQRRGEEVPSTSYTANKCKQEKARKLQKEGGECQVTG